MPDATTQPYPIDPQTPDFWNLPTDPNAYHLSPIERPGAGGVPIQGAPAGLPPGAVMVSPTQWVVYGPGGQIQGGGTIGSPSTTTQQAGQNPYNNPYAYTGNNLNTPYSQRFSYPGVPGLTPGPLGGEGGNGQGGGSFQGGWTGGTIPQGNPMDPGTIKQWLQQYSQTPGADPSAANDPDYWVRTIQQHGGLTQENAGYFGGRIVNPNSGGGGGYGGGAGGMQLSYNQLVSGMPQFNAPTFGGYSFSTPAGIQAPSDFQAPQDFSFNPYQQPQDFNADKFGYNTPVPTDIPGREKFVAPNLDETTDPGYRFRLNEQMRAIQNNASAQGARGGDVLKAMSDRSGDYASSEYDKVYGRSFGAFTEEQARALALYQTKLAAQGQGFGQAYNTSALNSQNAMGAAALNDQNALSAYQTNFNAQDLMHQQNFENAFNVYQGNYANKLSAAQLNSANQNASNALGWQVASGSFDRNYESALAQYQLPFQMGMQLANYNLGAQNQGFSQALQGYTTNYNAYTGTQGQQFNNLYNLSQLGASTTNNLNNTGSNFGSSQTNLVTGAGNANAANRVAQGNALSNGLTGVMGGVNTGLVAYSPLNPYRVPANTGLGTGTSMVPGTMSTPDPRLYPSM